MRRIRANAVMYENSSVAHILFVPVVLGLGYVTCAVSPASSAQAAGDKTTSPANDGLKRSGVALIDELLLSDERNAARIAQELRQQKSDASLIADRASEYVHNHQLKPHVRVALLEILLANEPATKRSFDAFTAVALDRSSPDTVRGFALEGLRAIGQRRRELPRVVESSRSITEDRKESPPLRLSAWYVELTANGAQADPRVAERIFKDPTEDVELRAGIPKSLSVLSLLSPEQSEDIAIILLAVGHDHGAPRAVRLETMSACWSVILMAELFDVRFEQARTAIHKVSRAVLLDEREDLAIRTAAGELLCALRRPDMSIVVDLIKVLRSTHAELQEIAARAICKIGPGATKARMYLVEIRDRRDISASLRKVVNEALVSLDTDD